LSEKEAKSDRWAMTNLAVIRALLVAHLSGFFGKLPLVSRSLTLYNVL
jgi:hypothetical protein